jgi:mono/diheme cytochrome c family protein
MSDTRDPKFSEDPDKQAPSTPAPTQPSQLFMTPEEVEPHKDKGHYDVVSDIKVGHGAIPKFLKLTFAVLAGWALFYMLTAKPVNDRAEPSHASEPSVEVGADAFATSCSACHNATAERKIGPGMLGAATRLGPEELDKVLHNGRPDKGMPAPPSLGLNDTQIASLKLYIQSLK